MPRATVTDNGVPPMQVMIFLCVTLEFGVQLWSMFAAQWGRTDRMACILRKTNKFLPLRSANLYTIH